MTIQQQSVPVEPNSIEEHWKRNLTVCVLGSFTTIIAMTMLLPFLPLYVEHLGVSDTAAIVQWSGVAYGATFLSAACTAPLWGRIGDRYGRKLMLIRASLGMAIAMSLIGMAENIYQLVGLRLLAGLLGGYASGATILVAVQTPKACSGWALGMLSSGIMAGNLAGPLIGGVLPPLVGIRNTFFLAGAMIFLTFLATVFLMKEAPRPKRAAGAAKPAPVQAWSAIPDKKPVMTMFVVASLMMFSIMSIEPIITVYLIQLHTKNVTLMAGVVMSATALASMLSASRIGKLADRIGHWKVVMVCLAVAALLLIPQAFVTNEWELVVLRFLMGIALGGMLPGVAAIIRHSVPDKVAGTMLGYSTSSQYVGQVLGPLAGGYVGGHFGMPLVFIITCVLMAGCAAVMLVMRPDVARTS
jgi:MFS family permease